MEWEYKVREYLGFFGYELLYVDDKYVHWKNKAGEILSSPIDSINYKMKGWGLNQ